MSLAPAIIATAIFLVLFMYGLGARGSLQTRRVHAFLLRSARQRAQQTFSIVVPLERRAGVLYPLLEHLRAHNYPKLQVVVLVKRTAGRRAQAELEAYRRATRYPRLKLVQYTRGMTDAVIAERCATGKYILTLSVHDRLSPHFLRRVSYVLATLNPEALAIREVIRPVRTFERALHSIDSLLKVNGALSVGGPLPEARIMMRRQALRRGIVAHPDVFAPHQFYLYTKQPQGAQFSWRPSWRLLAVLVLCGTIWALGGAYLWQRDQLMAQVAMVGVVGVLELMLWMCLLQARGYRSIDHLNLMLFLPLAPLYALGSMLRRGFIRGLNGVRHR